MQLASKKIHTNRSEIDRELINYYLILSGIQIHSYCFLDQLPNKHYSDHKRAVAVEVLVVSIALQWHSKSSVDFLGLKQ